MLTTLKRMLVGWIPAMVVAMALVTVFNTSDLETFLIGGLLGTLGIQVGLVLTRRG